MIQLEYLNNIVNVTILNIINETIKCEIPSILSNETGFSYLLLINLINLIILIQEHIVYLLKEMKFNMHIIPLFYIMVIFFNNIIIK